MGILILDYCEIILYLLNNIFWTGQINLQNQLVLNKTNITVVLLLLLTILCYNKKCSNLLKLVEYNDP